MKKLKIGSIVTYKGKIFMVLNAGNFGSVEMRQFHEERGKTAWLAGPVVRAEASELRKLEDMPAVWTVPSTPFIPPIPPIPPISAHR